MLVLAGVALWALSRQDAGGTAPPDAADRPTPYTEITGRPADAFPMTVGYVFDGDTIELQHDAPNEAVTTTAPIRVRLIGVDTPEGTPAPECWADEARAHLAALAPEGATVWVGLDAAGLDAAGLGASWDRYDRRLFYLWTDDGRFVNYELVAAGDAEALRVAPNDAHPPLFVGAQAAAQAAGAGRWGAC